MEAISAFRQALKSGRFTREEVEKFKEIAIGIIALAAVKRKLRRTDIVFNGKNLGVYIYLQREGNLPNPLELIEFEEELLRDYSDIIPPKLREKIFITVL